MPTITSRDDNGALTTKYTPTSNCNYERPELTDVFVRENAHVMTKQEMAKMFGIDDHTLTAHFGDVYNEALANKKRKRRRQFDLLLDQLSPDMTYDHALKDAKTNEYIKAYELWSRIYDGLGAQVAPVQSVSPLANLSTEELHAAIEALGYVKKDQA